MLGVSMSPADTRKLLAAVFAIAALCTAPLVRAEGPYLTFVETVADPVKNWAGNWTAQDGAVTNDLYGDGSYASQHTWSSPPTQIDGTGFTLSMQVSGSLRSECAPMFAGTQITSTSFEFSPNPASVGIDLVPPPNCNNNQGRQGANSGSFTAKPLPGLADGQLLALLMMIPAANAGTITGQTDGPLEPKHAEAMRSAVLDDLGAQTAYFSSLSYKHTASGEDRDVICGIVSHGGEYAFYFVVSENDATILPRLMGSGGRDMLIQQLQEVGCSSP